MFPDMFENMFERVKPALNEGMTTVQAYAERIIVRLDDIVDAVQQDETLNVRRVIPVVLTAADSEEVVQVPTDQDWILENFVVDADAGTMVRIKSGPIRAGITLAAAGVIATGGQNVVFGGGSNITVENSAGNTQVTLQFRYERKRSPYRATRAGEIQQQPKSTDARTEPVEDGRHANAGVWAGENVIGDRHISHPV